MIAMKDLSAGLVVCATIALASIYTRQIRSRKISPTLSTWFIFFLGTGLSLTTYAIAEDRDFRSGILNTMDFATTTVIFLAAIVWGDRGLRFERFEKWYLVGAGAIVAYGLLSGDAWGSNIFTQIIIGFGYLPTIQRLVREKKNTESFSGWGCAIFAGLFALYPALVGGNLLAAIYALRTIILVSVVMAIMFYYEIHSRRTRSEA